jgi:hypothetical protein
MIVFEDTMEKLNKHLLMKNGENFYKDFKNLHKIAVNTFPVEFFDFLRSIGFAKEINILQNNAFELLSAVDSYEVDTQNKVIRIKKGKAILEEPLCDLNKMIKNKRDIVPNSWQWHLLGSYFSDTNNFAMIQTAKAMILQERI